MTSKGWISLTKIGRNCSFPVDSPPFPKLSVNPILCSADPAVRLVINAVPNNAEIVSVHLKFLFPAACQVWNSCSQQPVLSHSGRGSLILPSGTQPWSCPKPASRHPHLSPRFGRCLRQHGWAGGATSQLAALHSFVCPGDNHFKAGMQWVRLPGEETATTIGRKELGNSDARPQVLPWAQIKWEAVNTVNTEKVERKKPSSPEHQMNLLYERFVVIEDVGVFSCSRNTVCSDPPLLACYHQPQATNSRTMCC